MRRPDVASLKERLDRSLRADRLREALATYLALEEAEPEEPRWPHRKGDLLRRLERSGEAIRSYERAVELYASQGFIARAVAMAKVVLGVDPDRIDVLERVDPEAAARVLGRRRAAALPASSGSMPPPAPGAGSLGKSAGRFRTLAPADDAVDGELRFGDEKSIELDLSELELASRDESLPELFLESLGEEKSAAELATLPAYPVFAELPREALVALGREAVLVELPDGAPVVRVGEPADALYVIVEGSVRVDLPETLSEDDATLAEGDVFGELCLLDGARRKADVFVRGRLSALKIPKFTLDAVARAHPAFDAILFELLNRRVVANLLRTAEVFASLTSEQRREVARLFEARRAEGGLTLIEDGKRSDGLYVLLAGRCALLLPDGEERAIDPVTILGQASLLAHAAADFTLRTVTECLFLRLPAASFTRLATTYPPVLAHLAELASRPLPAAIDAG